MELAIEQQVVPASCDCKKCRSCCTNIPGIPMPEQVVRIAEFLKMPLMQCLEQYFIVGQRDGVERIGTNEDGIAEYDMTEFVYPARVGCAGQRENWQYTCRRGACSFLTDDEHCMVHEVKPFECKMTFGCRERLVESPNAKALLAWRKAWKDGTVHPFIVDFIKTSPKMRGGYDDE